MFRLSERSWTILGVLVVGLLLLTYVGTVDEDESASTQRRAAPAGQLRDAPLPGGGTARLSQCGVNGGLRPEPRGAGERGTDPQMVLTSYGARDPGSKREGGARFTVHAAITAGARPLLLPAPLPEGRVTLDVHGPHGEGLRVSARGLTATVVDGGFEGKPVEAPASGRFRVAPGKQLLLEVELPAAALCPGYDLFGVGSCEPERTNDIEDCPVLVLTLADPAIREYRARGKGGAAESFSDRLVAIFYEPKLSEV
ncbi:hypothetical protein QNN03_21620 [Streptomyces sp. GXMU-J15]|uniref:Secreted protein n=1 Tax=Streptomyces fuscus TaxID=3048495 RepID=A0ABT7J2F5_9ACTN|nr:MULTISPECIES: hypothetical protein [Streptomyces]MDL2079038.1 hypothetical protein [Streptomyces fuscus]SBT94718.1 hypothetical protein GA0115233_110018 [Streptomyces sp. DI166]